MRRPGIEPGPSAWKAEVIPLDHRRKSAYADLRIPHDGIARDLLRKKVNQETMTPSEGLSKNEKAAHFKCFDDKRSFCPAPKSVCSDWTQ